MSQQQPNNAATANLDVNALLAALIKANTESANLQHRLLEREEAKDRALAAKEADAAARIERDRKQLLEQMKIGIRNKELQAEHCPHEDQRGGSTLYPISNNPDGRLRGLCTKCPIYIEPEHFEIDGNGKKTKVAEHPLYKKVLQRDQQMYSNFTPLTGY